MNKNTILDTLTFVGLIIAVVLLTRTITLGHVYSANTIVTKVDYDHDIVTCEDFNGDIWQFEGCEDWQEGDYCTLTLTNRGTLAKSDDVIVHTTYTGYTDEGEF